MATPNAPTLKFCSHYGYKHEMQVGKRKCKWPLDLFDGEVTDAVATVLIAESLVHSPQEVPIIDPATETLILILITNSLYSWT
jgi:hypothetical protein